jgi:hypothetical protein
MGTKRVELSALERVDVVDAMKIAADHYRAIAHSRHSAGWTQTAVTYYKWANRCLDIAAKLEDCDTVAIETDERDGPTCPECGTVHSELLYCYNTPLDQR